MTGRKEEVQRVTGGQFIRRFFDPTLHEAVTVTCHDGWDTSFNAGHASTGALVTLGDAFLRIISQVAGNYVTRKYAGVHSLYSRVRPTQRLSETQTPDSLSRSRANQLFQFNCCALVYHIAFNRSRCSLKLYIYLFHHTLHVASIKVHFEWPFFPKPFILTASLSI